MKKSSNKGFKKFYGRKDELAAIEDFLEEEGAGTLFIKGRRRIGKTWVLNKIKQSHRKNLFMYSGKTGSIKKECYQMLIQIEKHFRDIKITSLLKDIQEISPSDMFDRLIELLANHKGKPIFLIDEIQWIGDDNGKEFSGTLKEKWTELEENNKIKIIITGSSTRYFKEYLEKNEGILRGITDRDHIIIPPFSLGELKKYFFPSFSNEEVAFIHMATGGIAKYVDIIKKKTSKKETFVQCINKSFFIKGNYFIRESEDILTIDLNETRSKESIKILNKIGSNSIKLENLKQALKTELQELDLENLLYELVLLEILGVKDEKGEIVEDLAVIKNISVKFYYIKDPMLMFYHSVVYPRIDIINSNKNQLLFKDIIDSKTFPVIDGFTGEAFERLVRDVLVRKKTNETPIFKSMDLLDPSFSVNCYKATTSQIDCLVKNLKDSSLKIIECKWIGDFGAKSIEKYCEEVKLKKYPDKSLVPQYFYLYSIPVTKNRRELMKEKDVVVLTLEDLFDTVIE